MMVTNIMTIAKIPKTLWLLHRKVGRQIHPLRGELVREGAATVAVVILPSTVGITTDLHQGGLLCLPIRQTGHHLLVVPRHLGRTPLPLRPLTNLRRKRDAGTGQIPRKRTQVSSSLSPKVANGGLGGPIRSTQSSRPLVGKTIWLKIGSCELRPTNPGLLKTRVKVGSHSIASSRRL